MDTVTTKQKLLLGIHAIKEIIAKQDAEISAMMIDGERTEDLQDEFEDKIRLEKIIDEIHWALGLPIVETDIFVLTMPTPEPKCTCDAVGGHNQFCKVHGKTKKQRG